MFDLNPNFIVNKKLFFRIGKSTLKYLYDIKPTSQLLKHLRKKADLFTFIGRDFIRKTDYKFPKIEDNVALLKITSFSDWWEEPGRKARRRRCTVRKARKSGVEIQILDHVDDKMIKGIWKIYNETPYRQDRWFPHYGIKLEEVRSSYKELKNSELLCALWRGKLIGFVHLVYGDKVAVLSQILSSARHFDKAPNNTLISAAIKRCDENKIQYLIYGRMGNHPSLDEFKKHNSFEKFIIPRYYVPLTKKGELAIKLYLHIELKDVLPKRIKCRLIPIYNFFSRQFRF